MSTTRSFANMLNEKIKKTPKKKEKGTWEKIKLKGDYKWKSK